MLSRGSSQIRATLWGVEPQWHDAWSWYTSRGEEITGEDIATMARVCVIGSSVRRELFGDTDPLGESLYVNKVSLTVKGVLERRGTTGGGGGDFDNRILLPITTAMRRVLNVDHIGGIRIITRDAALMPQQSAHVVRLLRDRHHITPPVEDDFRITTPMAIADVARGTSRTLSILLIPLAGLSLLVVGGFGILAVLLISVRERIREIGLRRAVGARRRDIRNQFLLESGLLAGLGGLIGAAIGVGAASTVSALGYWDAVISWPSAAIGFVVSVLLGVAFGLYPAVRAADLEPIEALRSE